MIGVILSLIFCTRRPYRPSPIIKRLKYKVSLVNPKFASYDIREATEGSYTENKTVVYICTKDPETKKYYTDNTLIYVTLHECAHMLDKTFNDAHDEKFKKIFKELLDKAEAIGIYNPKIPIPPTYCGLN